MAHLRAIDPNWTQPQVQSLIFDVFPGLNRAIKRTSPNQDNPGDLHLVVKQGLVLTRPLDGKLIIEQLPAQKKDRLLVISKYTMSSGILCSFQ